MKVVVSSFFQVMQFPHNGNIVTVDQLSFINPNFSLTFQHVNPLSFFVLMMDSPLASAFHAGGKVPTFGDQVGRKIMHMSCRLYKQSSFFHCNLIKK